MTRMQKYSIVAFISLCVVLYFAGSVADASFNIAKWHETTRGVIASGMVFFAFMIGVPLLIVSIEKEK